MNITNDAIYLLNGIGRRFSQYSEKGIKNLKNIFGKYIFKNFKYYIYTQFKNTCITKYKETSKLKKILSVAISIFSLALAGCLTGLTINLLGLSMQASIMPKFLILLGKKVALLGENILIYSSTIYYATFYEIPKRIILSVPKLCNQISNFIHFIYNAAKVILKNYIAPFFNMVKKLIINTCKPIYYKLILPFWQKFMLPLIKLLKNKIISLAKFIFNYFLHPIWKFNMKCIKAIFRNIIIPATKFVYKLFSNILSKISILIDKIATFVSKIFSSYILPFFKSIGSIIRNYVTPFFKGVGRNIYAHIIRRVIVLAKFIFNNFIYPLHIKILNFTVKVVDALLDITIFLFNKIIGPIGLLIKDITLFLGKIFYQTGYFICRHIATFIYKITAPIISFSTKVLTFSKDLSINVIKMIYSTTIIPISNFFSHLGKISARRISYVISGINHKINYLLSLIS